MPTVKVTSENEARGAVEQALQNNYHNALIVKVGSEARPATQEDLEDTLADIAKLVGDQDINVMVTHHCIEFLELDLKRFVKSATV